MSYPQLSPHPPEIRAVYEIMCKNMVEAYRPQMIIWRMRVACWITKATDTLRICNTYYFTMTTEVTRTRLSVTCIRTLLVLYIVL